MTGLFPSPAPPPSTPTDPFVSRSRSGASPLRSAPSEVVEALARHIARWRERPWLFPREAHGVEPTAQQDSVLRVLKPGAHITIASGHGTGKTTLLTWIIEWSLICWNDVKVPCTAPTKPQIQDALWMELRKWLELLPQGLRECFIWHPDSVEVVGALDRRATARTARKENPEALQGIHAGQVTIVIDEASGVPEAIFEAGRGSLSTPGSIVVLAANPTRNTGYFHDSHTVHADRWLCFRFDGRESPRVDPKYIADIVADYGENSDQFRVRVAGMFPRQDICQFIARELVEAAASRVITPAMIAHAPRIFGLDVAWEGDDRTVLVERQGLASQILGYWDYINLSHLAGIIAQKEDERKAKAIFIDVGAMGPGVIDALRALGRRPIPVNFGAASRNPYYHHKRTEMWGDMRTWLQQGGGIPNEKRLIADLAAPMYSWLPSGAVALESKREMKARKLPSPDYADALALTFAEPVASEIRTGVALSHGAPRAQTEYDVLDMRR